jgi:amino acid adenylation domain-containing protein
MEGETTPFASCPEAHTGSDRLPDFYDNNLATGHSLPAPMQATVHELFEQQARTTPYNVAVTHGDNFLTYAQLDAKANQLARHLRDHGIAPDHVVGICLTRSLSMIVTVLGVLKAGGAYLPLDPYYPAERLGHMLEDASPTLLLTEADLSITLPTTRTPMLLLQDPAKVGYDYLHEPLTATEIKATPGHLAYVIYTSGSTGRPKGTAMPHHPMVNLIQWHRQNLGSGVGEHVLQFSALSFDVAFQEIFSTLCTGGTLVLVDEWIRKDAQALLELLSARSITRLFIPPLMLQALAESSTHNPTLSLTLRDIICAGEQLRITPEIATFFHRLPRSRAMHGCRLHNHYGPTETHVVTALTLAGDPKLWPALPTIGRPITNSRIYILDEQHRVVPTGTPGELYVGGVGMARGYLARPELTLERFLDDPFDPRPGSRMYRTGDLGRRREDGTIEYLGRNDQQVKIRGYRIELGEIEAKLLSHPGIKDAVVIARETNSADGLAEKQLVAYVTPRDTRLPIVAELREHLKAALPAYMIPNAIVILKALPVTPNGKLDRHRLPDPEPTAYVVRPYEPPTEGVEHLLASIWAKLLRVKLIGRDDNFFELGGHSLLIVQLMEHLRRLGLTADIRSIYASPTLADLAQSLSRTAPIDAQIPPNLIPRACHTITPQMLPLVRLEPEHIAHIVQTIPGGAPNIQDIYPLAPLQEGLLFHHLLNPQRGDAYVRPLLLSLPCRKSLDALITALQHVIDRHDILRTAVLWEQLPQPLQVVCRHVRLPIEHLALDDTHNVLEQLKEHMQPQHQRMDLRQAPLIRLQLAPANARVPHDALTDSDAAWYALLQTHHLVCDNESLEILLSEIAAHFQGRLQALPAPLPYRNHVAQSLAQARKHDTQAFFRDKLGDISEPTAPFGLLDVRGDGSRIQTARQQLECTVASRLRLQARRLGVSAATLFHAAWALVAAHTSGRDDVVFGTVLLGRMHGSAGTQPILGMFINTLPLRLSLRDLTAETLVRRTHQELAQLLTHEQASLAAAQRCSAIDASAPLFTSLLNYLHGKPHVGTSILSETSGIETLESNEWTNYPISLSVEEDSAQEGDARFTLTAQIDSDVSAARILEYMTTALRSLLDALELRPQAPALALPILPDLERRQVTEGFNSTDRPYPHDYTVHQLFETQAHQTPDAVAVICGQTEFTYAEINARANQLADLLSESKVAPGEMIPILLPRSFDLLLAKIAVLKCGAAYVPLDPTQPLDRLRFFLEDCAAKHVIADTTLEPALHQEGTHWIIYKEAIKACSRRPRDNPSPTVSAGAAAYVMYTSGSTGKPKGVVVPHRAINRLVINCNYVHIAPEDRIAHCSNPAFDASTFEVWGALLNGATVVIVPHAIVLDPKRLAEVIIDRRVTILWLTIGLFTQYAQTLSAVFSRLRYLMTGGDVVDPELMRRVKQDGRPQHLLNGYGPTECTTFSTTFKFEALADTARSVPIGRPISNTRVYILNTALQPVPIGAPGEIYIGGPGVALGYLNRPELTAARFIEDPFDSEARTASAPPLGTPANHARLYRTGDLGRWCPDGQIEFLGRNDRQIKIRGFRIEPSEIEAQVTRHAKAKQVVVTARQDTPGEKHLVAYLICERPPLDLAALRASLKSVLPEYMLPSAFVTLDSLPLTPGGKVDRQALPAPAIGSYSRKAYQAPEGETEEFLATLWQQLLRVQTVGRDDHFFELGGHSLQAMQLITRIRGSLSIEVPLDVLFQYPILRQFAASVEDLRQRRLLEDLASDDADLEKLLASVATLADGKVQEWVRELETGGKP